MPLMYKRYLFTLTKIPRRTAYRHRLKQQQQELASNRDERQQVNAAEGGVLNVQNTELHNGEEAIGVNNFSQSFRPNQTVTAINAQVAVPNVDSSIGVPNASQVFSTQSSSQDSVVQLDSTTEPPREYCWEEDANIDFTEGVNDNSGENENGSIMDTSANTSSEGSDHDQQEALNDEDNHVGSDPDCGFFTEEENLKRDHVHSLYSEALCACTTSTAGDAMLMVLALGLRHNLSWVAQVDILKMINKLYKKEVIPPTKHYFLKFVERGQYNAVLHFYCPSCEAFLGEMTDMPEDRCITCECGDIVKVSSATTYFISVGLESQFRELFENKDIWTALRYRFNRRKDKENALEDIFDGEEYKKHCSNGGILSNPLNFSYSFNTDGIPFGKSSKQTVWPIYVTLNELPPKLRAKHVLLAGLWVANKDPSMTNFLQPFVSEANKLSSQGMKWTHEGREVISKIIPLCAVVDSQARWRMLNMSQFSAHYGCTFCYQRTQYTVRGPRFVIPESKAADRTQDSTISDMRKAYNKRHLPQKKRLVKSVKGPSPLIMLTYFNMISGMVPDIMHCLLLGVVREHMELLFSSVRKRFWIDLDHTGIDHLIEAIDERLLCIRPPRSITRVPRKMHDRKLWKASEWRSWIIFYCIPCLSGLLKRKYLLHISMLSTVTNLILQKSIDSQDLACVKLLLLKYVYYFQQYFGESEMVYNVHLLTHIAKAVQDWGPSWGHNAFLYEGQNRYLLQQIKSPAYVARQLVRKFQTYNALPILCQQLASSTDVVEFCEDISGRKLKHLVRCGEVVLVGKGTIPVLSAADEVVYAALGIEAGSWRSFNVMIHSGIRFCTADYASAFKNNDSVLCTTDDKVVMIERILWVKDKEVLLSVREILCDKQPVLIDSDVTVMHIKRVCGHGQLLILSAKKIRSQCVLMELQSESFVCRMPYGCYGD